MKVRSFFRHRLIGASLAFFAVVVLAFVVWSGGLRPAVAQLGISTEIKSLDGVERHAFLQRHFAEPTRIAIGGRVGLLADRIEYAVTEAGAAVGPDGWQILDDAPGWRFSGEVELGAGRSVLFVRSSGARGIRTLVPTEILVGDLYVVAGQSNAAGAARTFFSSRSAAVRVAEIRDGQIIRWRSCADPQVRNGGGSVWPLVGDALVEKTGIPMGFVNCAVGATSIDDWQPGEAAFEVLISVLRKLGPQGIRAVLWHQGEADHGMTADEYSEKLAAVILGTRERVGWNMPWVVAQTSLDNLKTSPAVRSGQAMVWAKGLALRGPDTDVLDEAFREPDRVHFDANGTRAAAGLWVDRLFEIFYSNGDTSEG
ncbi:MAG: hypothetical protein D6781_09900 [Verrucomicrobia bacterium]|nr:MAG: hypothetical protein D6781_09900 [Verrucomicrobiota bacterium]